MVVNENIWLDDKTFIVDGKKMTPDEVGKLTELPKRVTMSPANKKLIDSIRDARVADVLRTILKGKNEK